MEKGVEPQIGKPCQHEIDPNTLIYKKGHSQGKCIKCGLSLTRIYPVNRNPKRIKLKLNKKERKKLKKEKKNG